MKCAFSALIILILLYGCGDQPDTQVEAEEGITHVTLMNTEWKLIRLQTGDLTQTEVIDNQPTLNFNLEELRVYGFGGCNQYTGSFLIGDDNSIEFSSIASTKMACPEMEIEQTFYKQIENVTTFEIDENDQLLVLTDEESEEVLVFQTKE
ncbi:MAG: META domain-containing protein [Balneolaceae bacterium]|nr:MAG: META domain-containing protein [Balneolaceae bacterium]